MEKKRILIVDDEVKIARILQEYLEREGFTSDMAESGEAALQSMRRHPPDLVLLDIMLPGMDGLSVCREIRKTSSVPVIMLTARVEEFDRLLGLELGSDDYICKPFSPREVVARVKAVLRRARPAVDSAPLSIGPIMLDEARHLATAGGRELRLTPCEFGLLKAFLTRPNQVYSRSELLNLVQGYDFEGYDRAVDSHIKNLRRKLAACLPGTDPIATVYGVGYKLDLPEEG